MADTATEEIEETEFNPDGWTVQDGPMPYVEPDPALAPVQFLPEQLPDPEGAKNAGFPEITVPEGQVNENAADHVQGPEPDELVNLGMLDEVPETETVENTPFLQTVPDDWTVNSPEVEQPAEDEVAEDDGEVDLSVMTKAEIQEWADENGYEVNQNTMTKDEMIEAIIG